MLITVSDAQHSNCVDPTYPIGRDRWNPIRGLRTGYANLSDKIGQTHVEMFEISNNQLPQFSNNQALNDC